MFFGLSLAILDGKKKALEVQNLCTYMKNVPQAVQAGIFMSQLWW